MATKKLKESTRENYLATWNNHVKNDLGLMKVLQVRPSHIKLFYSNMSKAGYSRSMITLVDNLLYPAFEMAEQGLAMKVVQYLMGHANIDVTMQVYNHITEQNRVRKEVAKLTTWKVV